MVADPTEDAARESQDAAARLQRGVVSYVRRSPRMNPSQRMSMERLSDHYLIELPAGDLSTSLAPHAKVDWDVEFGMPVGPGGADLRVEIGSGTGHALAADALAHPGAALVAFEVYERAVASTMSKPMGGGPQCVDPDMVDGAGLGQLFAPASISQLATYFPTRGTRSVTTSGVWSARSSRPCLPADCCWRWLLATDWPDYAAQMREVLDAGVAQRTRGDRRRPAAGDASDHQVRGARGLAEGRPVADLAYWRVP